MSLAPKPAPAPPSGEHWGEHAAPSFAPENPVGQRSGGCGRMRGGSKASLLAPEEGAYKAPPGGWARIEWEKKD